MKFMIDFLEDVILAIIIHFLKNQTVEDVILAISYISLKNQTAGVRVYKTHSSLHRKGNQNSSFTAST